MSPDEFLLRRGLVLASALIYWGGVFLQVRRVRRRIGRSPNVHPRGGKEGWLWLGWLAVIAGWFLQPLFVSPASGGLLGLCPAFLHPAGLAIGACLLVAGLAGTYLCYAALGQHWRMGIDHSEKNPLVTRGPYRFIRHPIYSFQMLLLVGAALLLPTLLSLLILLLHFICVWVKASDEETYLLGLHGAAYREYQSRTGRLLPNWAGDKRGVT